MIQPHKIYLNQIRTTSNNLEDLISNFSASLRENKDRGLKIESKKKSAISYFPHKRKQGLSADGMAAF